MGNPRVPHGHDHSENEFESFPVGAIIMYDGSFVNNVTMKGWYICDGNNGTPNLVNKFIRSEAVSGNVGGSDSHTLTEAEIPHHTHGINYYYSGGTGSPACSNMAFQTAFCGAVTCSSSCGGGAHENRPAYYSLIFIQKRV